MPVLKTHFTYGITAAVKNHMGVVTRMLSTDSHNAVRRGGLGTILAEVRMPALTILDCIWILAHPGSGPAASYELATRRNQLLAGFDPPALDVWATKHIMIPQVLENGYDHEDFERYQDPDNDESVFRTYLDRSVNEMLLGGIPTTNDSESVRLHVWAGDLDRDGDVDLVDLEELRSCSDSSGERGPGECEDADLDRDGMVGLTDFGRFQLSFSGAL